MSGYIRSPMNYTGGKYKLLDAILPYFPTDIHNFVDLFCGGLNVGINVDADRIYANDQISYIIELYEYFKETDTEELIDGIKARVDEYGLTDTNLEGYNALRDEYNRSKRISDLFVLTCFSFNHQIRFNNSHDFNTSFGKHKGSFNKSIENNLINFCEALHSKDIVFSKGDFRDFDFSVLNAGDVVYCDPPYLISNAAYNDGKRGFKDWTTKEDSDLFDLLDSLNSKGIRFVLSDVFVHQGEENKRLIGWSEKYRTIHLAQTYSNCSYHKKDRQSKTDEVLVMNIER